MKLYFYKLENKSQGGWQVYNMSDWQTADVCLTAESYVWWSPGKKNT